MLTRRVWLLLAILVVLVGCHDAAAPSSEQRDPGSQASLAADSSKLHVLQQSPTAPPLETYQVSFWAWHDRETTVAVDYRSGEPFLRFHIPKFGLMWRPDGTRLWGTDSLLITMTLDTVNLAVEFQPSGVRFSKVFAAQLVMWYAQANPDLNGDGVVDDTDQELERKLTIWGHSTNTKGWFKVSSKNDAEHQYVVGNLYHFSQYAVVW